MSAPLSLTARLYRQFIRGAGPTTPVQAPEVSRLERTWLGLKTMCCFLLVIHEAGMYPVEVERHDFGGMLLRGLMGASFLWWGVEGVVQIGRTRSEDKP